MARNDLKDRRKVREITDRGAQKARIPGAPSLGATPGSGFSTGVYISPQIDSTDYVDEDNVPQRGFMLGVDTLGDPSRFLIVKGVKRKYAG